MKRLVLLFILLGAIAGCFRTTESEYEVRVDNRLSPPELSCGQMEGEPQVSSERRISFENISFSLGQAWVRDVEYFATPECILTSDDIKPDAIGGRTVRFNLRYIFSDDEAHISIFKIEDYKKAFASYPQYVENRDAELRSLIANGLNVETYGLRPPPHVSGWTLTKHSMQRLQ